jgi:tetratricopeptide (TPR) repeat protein
MASRRTTDDGREPSPPARTRLEHLIRHERAETYEEFVAYAEEFARRHGLSGTIGVRHLLRLAAGRKADGSPLGPPRPATAKLLERIFGVPIGQLLGPAVDEASDSVDLELRQRLHASRYVDLVVIDLFREQLDALRRLDRQMGAIVAYGEVRAKVEQVRQLHTFCLTPGIRAELSRLLAELGALAGWEALDRYDVNRAWRHHELAKHAAREAEAVGLLAHATAQQALVLAELGEVGAAVHQLGHARTMVSRAAPDLLRAWLAAAHGEGLAAAGQRDEALRAFDEAGRLLPADPIDPGLPFLFLAGSHLDRWRGHALAELGDGDAVEVLARALERLDPTFIRAETTLRVDLATALVRGGEAEEARSHVRRAHRLADEIGSARQQRRIRSLSVSISVES